MSEIAIPLRSLERLRAAYQQFETLSGVVAEAMGVDPTRVRSVNINKGVFVVNDGDNVAETAVQHQNGVSV